MITVNGFSKLSKREKIDFIRENYLDTSIHSDALEQFWHPDQSVQKLLDEFSENTISNFVLPYGVVPNVLIDGKMLTVPMAIEESSVVAACSRAAKFWLTRGGIKTEILGTKKVGQVHFLWNGSKDELIALFNEQKQALLDHLKPLVENMEKRGGGILTCDLIDRTESEEDYFQLYFNFETCDAMGANFINSVLEAAGKFWGYAVTANLVGEYQTIMAILSNYTPECLVRAKVECPLADLVDSTLEISSDEFSKKFARAIRIAEVDINRATTHNKGIFNGVDAVILATGNDFRAVEACGHTFAAKDGQYRGLSRCSLGNGQFTFWLDLPLAVGTVGGLTSLHPLAKVSLEMLGNPSAKELMSVAAGIGLLQNFAAIRSLVTSGIQKGHMKMHLMNILNHLEATEEERKLVVEAMKKQVVSFHAVREMINKMRSTH